MWTNSGEFHKSCEDCRLTNKFKDKTQYLVCDCWGTDDEKQESRVDLAEVMYSRGGKLGCFEHLGANFDRPPKYWNEDSD